MMKQISAKIKPYHINPLVSQRLTQSGDHKILLIIATSTFCRNSRFSYKEVERNRAALSRRSIPRPLRLSVLLLPLPY